MTRFLAVGAVRPLSPVPCGSGFPAALMLLNMTVIDNRAKVYAASITLPINIVFLLPSAHPQQLIDKPVHLQTTDFIFLFTKHRFPANKFVIINSIALCRLPPWPYLHPLPLPIFKKSFTPL